jgi:hypothetical protein
MSCLWQFGWRELTEKGRGKLKLFKFLAFYQHFMWVIRGRRSIDVANDVFQLASQMLKYVVTWKAHRDQPVGQPGTVLRRRQPALPSPMLSHTM